MATNHKEVLEQVFGKVLEEVAFMFADAADPEELPDEFPEALEATMTFVGMMQGAVGVVVSPEMCLEVAANMLGVDPDDEEAMDKGRDALKELLNITCGHLLTSIAGDEPVFDLTVPEVTELDGERWQELKARPDAAVFLVDDAPALLWFEENENPEA